MQLSGDCSDRAVCEHISTALDPPSSPHRRRNILLRSGGLFLVTLAKWKGGSGTVDGEDHKNFVYHSNIIYA